MDDHARKLTNDGFERGRVASTMFYHLKTPVRAVVHGDDFIFVATERDLKKMCSKMSELCDIKVRGILGSTHRTRRS